MKNRTVTLKMTNQNTNGVKMARDIYEIFDDTVSKTYEDGFYDFAVFLKKIRKEDRRRVFDMARLIIESQSGDFLDNVREMCEFESDVCIVECERGKVTINGFLPERVKITVQDSYYDESPHANVAQFISQHEHKKEMPR